MTQDIPSAHGAVDLTNLAAAAQQHVTEVPGAATWTKKIDAQSFQEFVALSQKVPAVVSLGTTRAQASTDLDALLTRLVDERGGRLVLGLVDAEANPQIAQAFQAQQLPLVMGLINSQPVPLLQSIAPEEQVNQLLDQLLELGVQHGVAGTAPSFGGAVAEEPELPPLHQKAVDAIEAGDYAAAEAAYLQALNEKPNDAEAQVGVYQVRLLSRTQNLELNTARDAAAQNPDDLKAQMDVADLDVAGGHVEDAFARLVSLIARLGDEDRDRVRKRLIELYAVVGNNDPRVSASRQKLARVLF